MRLAADYGDGWISELDTPHTDTATVAGSVSIMRSRLAGLHAHVLDLIADIETARRRLAALYRTLVAQLLAVGTE